MNTPVLTIDERHNIESGAWFSQALAAAARRHPVARRGAPASPTATPLASARLAGRRMVRRGARRGAHQLGLAVGQAGDADLCRAGHLVRRHRAVRRPAAHARCQCAWRDHAAGGAQGRLQGAARPACGAVRRAAAPELPPPAPDVRPGRGPQHAPAARRGWPSRSCCWRAATASPQGEEIRIGLQLAQEDLAQLLGASRQRVNQELKGFEREGAVRVEPTRLVVLSTREAAGASPSAEQAAHDGGGHATHFTGHAGPSSAQPRLRRRRRCSA